MANLTDIYNAAFIALGVDTVNSPDTDSPNVRAVNAVYEGVRDQLLSGHPWNFAMRRKELAQSATAPTFGYDYAYDLPVDLLTMRTASPRICEVEGKQLLTDEPQAYVTYTAKVSDINSMIPLFRTALSLALAIAASGKVGSVAAAKLAELVKLRDLTLMDARAVDAQGGGNPPTARPNRLVLARAGYPAPPEVWR